MQPSLGAEAALMRLELTARLAQQRPQFLAKAAVGFCAVLLFALPQALFWFYGARLMMAASEPISYRYFHVLRQAAGAGADVWLPQGQLTSLIYRLLTIV